MKRKKASSVPTDDPQVMSEAERAMYKSNHAIEIYSGMGFSVVEPLRSNCGCTECRAFESLKSRLRLRRVFVSGLPVRCMNFPRQIRVSAALRRIIREGECPTDPPIVLQQRLFSYSVRGIASFSSDRDHILVRDGKTNGLYWPSSLYEYRSPGTPKNFRQMFTLHLHYRDT